MPPPFPVHSAAVPAVGCAVWVGTLRRLIRGRNLVNRRLVVILCAVVVAGAGCTSGSSSPAVKPVPKAWDAGGLASIAKLTARVTAAMPGECADGAPVDMSYVTNARRLGLAPIPLAIVDCTASDMQVEFNAMASNADRDRLMTNHRDVLCKQAKKVKVALPGLHWSVGEKWVVQTISEAVSRDVAKVLGGEYKLTPCPGAGQVDWDNGALAKADDLVAKLTAAGLGCTDAKLADRELVAHDGVLGKLGTPAAETKCTAAGAPATIEVFGPGATANQGEYVSLEAKTDLCGSARGAIVNGPDWSVLVTTDAAAKQIARALGGTVTPPSCA